MSMLPDKVARDLVFYKVGTRDLNRRSANILKKFTSKYDLGDDFKNTAVFRGVDHALSDSVMLDDLVNDEPVLLRRSPQESWSVDYKVAHEFSISGGSPFSIVLFERKPKPNSMIANMASPNWWDLYFDVDNVLGDDYSSWMEVLEGYSSREFELLLEPQCDKCIFKENVAWIHATLDFWLEYKALSDVPVYFSEYNSSWAPEKYYYGTYFPKDDAVELLGGSVDLPKELFKHIKRRVGRTMVRVK